MLFFVVLGMLVWSAATLACTCSVAVLWSMNMHSLATSALLAALASTAGIVTVIANHGWFDDPLPQDGCYRIVRDASYVPIGNTAVTVQINDARFVGIRCT